VKKCSDFKIGLYLTLYFFDILGRTYVIWMVQVIEYRFPTFEKRLVTTGQKKRNKRRDEVAGTKGTFWGEAKFRNI
jgi:hypothetical protein